jgi:hypothetical protein
MMLRFQWDSLRRGDHFLARDAAAPPTDAVDICQVVAARFAAHPDPIGGHEACWRGTELARAA